MPPSSKFRCLSPIRRGILTSAPSLLRATQPGGAASLFSWTTWRAASGVGEAEPKARKQANQIIRTNIMMIVITTASWCDDLRKTSTGHKLNLLALVRRARVQIFVAHSYLLEPLSTSLRLLSGDMQASIAHAAVTDTRNSSMAVESAAAKNCPIASSRPMILHEKGKCLVFRLSDQVGNHSPHLRSRCSGGGGCMVPSM